MKTNLKRCVCLLLCTLFVLPLLCGNAFAAADTDPLDGRYKNETPGLSLFSSDSYTEAQFEHESRFLNGYAIVGVIDVSKYQGEIDWNSVYAAGIRNVMVRAGYRGSTQGSLNTDERFAANVQGALAAGLRVGVYFFSQAINQTEALEEADYVLNLIRGYNITLPVAFDCEYAEGTSGYTGRFYEAKLDRSTVTANCLAFAERIRNGGYKPMVYANAYMFSTAIYPEQVSACCQIWFAAHRTKADSDCDFSMWQYSAKGIVAGINSNVDMSFWYISSADAADARALEITSAVSSLTVEKSSVFAATPIPVILEKLFDSYTVSAVSWRSSNEAVLTVDQAGNVTALAQGSATVTATVTVQAAVNGSPVEYTYEDSRDVTVTSASQGFFAALANLFTLGVKLLTALISAIASLIK